MYVYVLEDKYGSMYIGISNDPIRRLAEHKDGRCRTSSKLNKASLKILHTWLTPSFSLASRFERYLHGCSKEEVLDLITDCPFWGPIHEELAETKSLQRFEIAKDKGVVHDPKYDLVSLPNKQLLSRVQK